MIGSVRGDIEATSKFESLISSFCWPGMSRVQPAWSCADPEGGDRGSGHPPWNLKNLPKKG